ncbi:MAG: helix-turn-helix domain-containing protein [Bacteroides sp.]|nr:helix-turn-helix domain-containing protein [Bacteroides sp.]
MTSYEADFYFYLLKECNSRNWTNPFELPSRNVELELGISRKTICDLRNKLQQKGLISFKEGNRRISGAIYQILYVSDGNKNGNESGNINGNESGNINGNPLYKHKQKRKGIGDNSGELFPPDLPPPKKKPPKPKVEFIPPTAEEVKEYFRDKLPDWEMQADIFYNHFSGLGWKTATGAKVERWDSRANLWIIEKKQQNNGKDNRKVDKAAKARMLLDEYAVIEQGSNDIGHQAEIPDL